MVLTPAEQADAALRTAFLRAYPGTDGDDQWWWLAHPDEPAPSGVEPPGRRLARARTPLFRREAATADRERYDALAQSLADERSAALRALAHAQDAQPAAASSPDRRSGPRATPRSLVRSRPLLVVGAVLVAALTAGGIALATANRRAPASTAITAKAIAVTPAERARIEFEIAFAQQPSETLLPPAIAQQSSAVRTDIVADRLQNDLDELDGTEGQQPAAGRAGDAAPSGTMTAGIGIGSIAAPLPGSSGGIARLAVAFAAPQPWQAALTLRLDRGGTRTVEIRGARDTGALQSALVLVSHDARLTDLRLTGPRGVVFVWSVLSR